MAILLCTSYATKISLLLVCTECLYMFEAEGIYASSLKHPCDIVTCLVITYNERDSSEMKKLQKEEQKKKEPKYA